MEPSDFTVRFWGVRGSMPNTGNQYSKFGGNTACIELQIGGNLVILDAGTGLHHLGKELNKSKQNLKGHLFFSHVHWDHLMGFPFFSPVYQEGNIFHIYGEQKKDLNIKDQLASLMSKPFWPVGLEVLKANLFFHDIHAGDSLTIDKEIHVNMIRGNHPDDSLLFRIEYGDKSFCYISDYEHMGEPDQSLIEFVHKCDVMVYDAAFTENEYRGLQGETSKKGWGHSTWLEGCKLSKLANVKQLILFHHDINRSDVELEQIEKEAKVYFPKVQAAFEGMKIKL